MWKLFVGVLLAIAIFGAGYELGFHRPAAQVSLPFIVQDDASRECADQITWDGKISYSVFCTTLTGPRCSMDAVDGGKVWSSSGTASPRVIDKRPAMWYPARANGMCYAEDAPQPTPR